MTMKPLTEHQWSLIDALRDPTKTLQVLNGTWQDLSGPNILRWVATCPNDVRIKPEPRKVTRWLYAKEANILVEPRYSFDAYEHILVTYYPDEPDRDKRVVATLEDVK